MTRIAQVIVVTESQQPFRELCRTCAAIGKYLPMSGMYTGISQARPLLNQWGADAPIHRKLPYGMARLDGVRALLPQAFGALDCLARLAEGSVEMRAGWWRALWCFCACRCAALGRSAVDWARALQPLRLPRPRRHLAHPPLHPLTPAQLPSPLQV